MKQMAFSKKVIAQERRDTFFGLCVVAGLWAGMILGYIIGMYL
jgi:hypothetical protein